MFSKVDSRKNNQTSIFKTAEGLEHSRGVLQEKKKEKEKNPGIFSCSSSFLKAQTIPQPIFPLAFSFNVLPQKAARVKKGITEFSSIILSISNICNLVYTF